ncbi:MAG: 4Fe-4S dicluster domain-containing protein [Ignavibacteriae bacterium]|nr:MAG: 4Fe-4S dicluster domain-containing protein [Ignavibacteriota bacterium]
MDKKIDITNLVPQENNEQKSEQKEINYWRSFRELHNDPDFLKEKNNEFKEGVTDDFEVSKLSVLSRRKFLALLSASAALAATGCSDYKEKGSIVPYNKKPEEIIVGLPNFYASTCTSCNNACGILVKTREGRPIKIDGNPDHPVSKGKICAKGQASILNLYDPGRLKDPVYSSDRQNHRNIPWGEVDDKIIAELKTNAGSGKEIAIVTHRVISPSYKKLLDEFIAAYPTTKVYSYELFDEGTKNSAWTKTYGRKTYPVVKLENAKVILALESDFLTYEGNAVENMRLFAMNRDVMNGREFNRLYVVEGAATSTGFTADYRMRLRTDAIEEFVLSLLNEFLVKRRISSFASDVRISGVVQSFQLEKFAKKYNLDGKALNALVEDLIKNQGNSIVLAGNKLPESTHIAVNLLNDVLGNTKLYSADSEEIELQPLSQRNDIETLIGSMNAGNVGMVIHAGTNPVYHIAHDYGYTDAVKKVPTVITIADMLNESSEVSQYVLPLSHILESWGDYRTRTNFYSLQQPMIAPLYRSRQKEAMLLTWLRGNKEAFNENLYHEYVMQNWEKNIFPVLNSKLDFKKFWNASLHDGVAYINEKPAPPSTFIPDAFAGLSSRMTASEEYIVLLEEGNLGDGRFANNGWLQELPHPVSKIVWDNYAAVSVQTAADLGVNNNDNIEVLFGERHLTLPVFVQPGLADKVVEIQLGYGRTKAGDVGSNVGFNANVLLTKHVTLSSRFFNNAKVSKVTGTHELVTTQENHAIDESPLLKDIQFKRGIIVESTYNEFKKNPALVKGEKEKVDIESVNREHKYTSFKWGMSIDLNKCTGCSACVIACNVENNIPVVGKEQVKKGREMTWLRIDRYYHGTPDTPQANFQPMLCQHCDFAPCENVCPVAATTHSADGLNIMAYNRCVGTRYCSNNCPYKVRRFNYFNFRDHFNDAYYDKESVNLMYNPEVTVRSRGVMEKCTFCVQRVMDERQHAIEQNRNVEGANVTTACQDACPSYAIVFGNINDKESEVYKHRENAIGYLVLEEIKTAPNVTYFAKLRNTEEKA